jgi:hypothetical protein
LKVRQITVHREPMDDVSGIAMMAHPPKSTYINMFQHASYGDESTVGAFASIRSISGETDHRSLVFVKAAARDYIAAGY